MTIVRLDVRLPEGASEREAEEAVVYLRERLAEIEAVAGSEVQPVAPDRSLAAVAAVIAVAAPVVKETAEAIKALAELFTTLSGGGDDEKTSSRGGRRVLQAVPMENILVRTPNGYVPLTELTLEDLSDE